MKKYRFELLFAVLVGARAMSFAFNKILLQHMGTMSLIALRFLAATILLIIIFPKKITGISKSSLLSGTAIGVSFFVMIVAELSAVKTADTSLVSIVEHVSIILVPIINAILTRKMFGLSTAFGAILAFLGIMCLGLQGGSVHGSIWMSLLAAFLYAIVIIITDRVTTPDTDSITVGIVQLAVMGILALLTSLFTDGISFPNSPSEWVMLVFLVIVCTAFGYTLTPYAQSHISVDRAGIICAVNPMVATLFGIIILHERLSILGILGIILILLSIVFPYLPIEKRN